MIIGITGTFAAGKGTVVEFLLKRDFKHYSVREFLTKEILRRGIEVSQGNMFLVANDLREKFGPSYIVEELHSLAMKEGGNAVIESIRCPGEVDALRAKKEFVLFAVDADVEVRYARIIERKDNSEEEKNFTFDKFIEREQAQMGNDDPTKQNLQKCIEMSDYVFKNDWTVEELHGKVGAVLGKVGSGEKYVRPTWDEYFMEIVHAVSRRGTCDRGRTATIVVKDKVILVTGYVGSPMGCPHCDEAGHLMKEVIHENGSTSKHCMRTNHAEINAVALAARKGIAIEGATMYMKMSPCYTCAKMLINAGIKRIVCNNLYHQANEAIELLRGAGIQLDVLNEVVEKYDGQ